MDPPVDPPVGDPDPAPPAGGYDALAKRGIRLLFQRQVVIQIFTFSGGIVLARVLSPAEFGLFGIANFLVHTLAMFGDFGLAPSFIQRREDPSERDLQVGFTLQLALTSGVVAALWLLAPRLVALYPAVPAEVAWLVRALAVSVFLSSWRAMSVLQLERRLDYRRLAWIEVTETVSYQGIAVVLVLLDFGVWSLVWATLTRGVLGAVLTYLLRPWPVRLAFDRRVAWEILRYGLPFQGARMIHRVGGWVNPILVGALIGPEGVGFVTWASSNGRKPLLLVNSVRRVAFTHFSRLQDDWQRIERTLVRYLTYLLLPTGLWFVLILAAGAQTVELIYTAKWLPAVSTLTLYALAANLNVIGWLVGNTLDATGYVGRAAKRTFTKTAVMFGASVPLVWLLGIDGVPGAEIVSTALMIAWMLRDMERGMTRKILGPLRWLLAPVLLCAPLAWLPPLAAGSLPLDVAARLALAVALYTATAWLFAPAWLKAKLGRVVHRLLAPRSAPSPT